MKILQRVNNVKLLPCLSSQLTVKRSLAFDRIAIQVKRDGSCLCKAVSCAMFWSERQSLQIRAHAAITMATKSDVIKKIHHSLQFENVCWDYSLSFQEVCTVGAFSCAYHMIAIAVAFNQPITSVYPLMNDCVDEPYKVLNTTISPRNSAMKPPIFIHWTGPRTSNRHWMPNHFEPLLL